MSIGAVPNRGNNITLTSVPGAVGINSRFWFSSPYLPSPRLNFSSKSFLADAKAVSRSA